MEQFYEHGIDLHFLFIDFKHAFDSIDRGVLYKTLQYFKMQPKIIRLIKMTMENTKAKVKVMNKLSPDFDYNTGVRQGDGLSATLFNLALHRAVEKIDSKCTTFFKFKD